MKRFAFAAAATLIAGAAIASMPVFVATCPTGINVDAGRTGVVLINGKKATVKKLDDSAFDAKSGGITISVTANAGKAPDVFYTGKGRANGVCSVTGFESGQGAAPPAADGDPAQSGASASASGIQTQVIQFAEGHSSATVNGSINGDQIIDYSLRASAGQTMRVKLDTKHTANYFNVLPPASETALFIGSTSGNEWTGELPADGEYRVRVYLMHSAARRHESANYSLTVGITGTPSAKPAMGTPPASDAKVAGTPYHATSTIPCSMGDSPKAQCELGVIRGKPGNAEVHVTPPGAFNRVLIFMGDKVTSEGAKVKAGKHGDMWSVDVNDYEHYQIPEAVIVGG